MQFLILKETHPGERRIALLPAGVERLTKAGAEVVIESGLGESIEIQDEAYTKVGATVTTQRADALAAADVALGLRKPSRETVAQLKRGAIWISHLDPFNERPLIDALAAGGIQAISVEMIPRTTIAQKMDALSSQANLGGYVAVIMAAAQAPKVLPMMMTPAGTLSPARVFIIGAGVAGLQAIATAKRLGARVEAFDTRPVVEEQVASLGAKFVKVDLGETGQTKDGYARELTDEQLAKQREAMAKACAQADIVITTAQVFGRPAPVIITDAMIQRMQPGSVIVDMAVETGGNVEGSELDQEVVRHGVKILGHGNLPGRVPEHASQMYSSNLTSFIDHFWDAERKALVLNADDEIVAGARITFEGQIVNPLLRKRWNLDTEAS